MRDARFWCPSFKALAAWVTGIGTFGRSSVFRLAPLSVVTAEALIRRECHLAMTDAAGLALKDLRHADIAGACLALEQFVMTVGTGEPFRMHGV